jgi:hypothetical protein
MTVRPGSWCSTAMPAHRVGQIEELAQDFAHSAWRCASCAATRIIAEEDRLPTSWRLALVAADLVADVIAVMPPDRVGS